MTKRIVYEVQHGIPASELIDGEEWRDVPGFEGAYCVSNLGRVYSLQRVVPLRGDVKRVQLGRMMAQVSSGIGYVQVVLRLNGKRRSAKVQWLVAEAFLGPRPPGMQVAHGDGCRTNNTLSNLRYDTQKGNEKDKLRHGTAIRGERVKTSKLTASEVLEIRAASGKHREIAEKFGVSTSHVTTIKQGRRWAHLGASHG